MENGERAMARVGIWLALTAQFMVGCGRRQWPLPAPGPSNSPVVALVAGAAIHASDVAVQMQRTGADRRHAVQDLLTFEILARAAADAGIDARGPAERAALSAVKVQRLVEREIEPRITPQAIEEGDVRALYDRERTRFVHGRLVEVAMLCVFTGARMKSEARARAEQSARLLRAFLDGRRSVQPADFQSIAQDAAWIARKVTYTTAWQGEDQPFPRVVGRAVQALSRPGQMTDLVGDETGYYVALYLSEKEPLHVSFADAAPILRGEMFEPWRRQRFLQLSLSLAQGHDIEVFPENFPLLAEGPH